MRIQDTLEYIHNVKWQASKPGLSRTRVLLGALGNPEKQLRFVHVAGTNGKGSTCACVASVLQKAGYTVGLYTSPYIMRFNERIQVNGRQISDEELTGLVEQIKPYADAMEDSPTEFEIITALALKYFADYGCDVVVLEVGMGGELDSTNVIDTPDLAVITAIDFDHVEHLGPTLRDIARAKGGIIKPGGDVLVYGGNADVEEVLSGIATERGAKLHKAIFPRITKAEVSLASTRLVIEPYEEMRLPLAGAYQPYNALMAVTALEILREKGYKISIEDIIEGIGAVKWPGRFEFLGYDPVFISDGAHNVHGTKAAAQSLSAYFGERKIIFIMGVLADKDAGSMAAALAAAAQQVYTVPVDNPRAMDAEKLASLFSDHGIPVDACRSVSEGVGLALSKAGESEPKGIICALGSLFMSADVKIAYEKIKGNT